MSLLLDAKSEWLVFWNDKNILYETISQFETIPKSMQLSSGKF